MNTQDGGPLSAKEVLFRIRAGHKGRTDDAVEALRAADPQCVLGAARVCSGLATRLAPPPAARLARRWGIVLAGGDGVRLRGLTRLICGDERPKQFCPLLGECTLFEETRQRVERSVRARQVFYSVTKAHQDYYGRDLEGRRGQTVVQPCNRGTAPAILSSLLCISESDPEAIVAILPCDHYYSPEAAFTAALESAFALAEEPPGSVVLLGADPKAPETEYGWIELGDTVFGSHSRAFHVERFHEKPSFALAARLFRTGSLWNTFVMVGHVRAFLDLALEFVPELMEALRLFEAGRERQIPDWLYGRIAPTDFSRQVLSPGAARLVSLKLDGIQWNDLGDPERVIGTLAETIPDLPAWARRWRSERQTGCTALPPASA